MAVTMSERRIFLGAHVTEKVKGRLEQESMERSMSQSALVFEIIRDYFIRKDRDAAKESKVPARSV